MGDAGCCRGQLEVAGSFAGLDAGFVYERVCLEPRMRLLLLSAGLPGERRVCNSIIECLCSNITQQSSEPPNKILIATMGRCRASWDPGGHKVSALSDGVGSRFWSLAEARGPEPRSREGLPRCSRGGKCSVGGVVLPPLLSDALCCVGSGQ